MALRIDSINLAASRGVSFGSENKDSNVTTNEGEKKGLSTTTKVIGGVAALAILGTAIYCGLRGKSKAAQEAAGKAGDLVDDLSRKGSEVVETAEEAVEDVAKKGSEIAEEVVEEATKKGADVVETAEEVVDDAAKKGSEIAEEVVENRNADDVVKQSEVAETAEKNADAPAKVQSVATTKENVVERKVKGSDAAETVEPVADNAPSKVMGPVGELKPDAAGKYAM